jgi:thiamine-monophosphate kinase
MTVDHGALPVEPAARSWFVSQGGDPAIDAIAGGDDYELLFTVRPAMRGRLRTVTRHAGVSVTRIGVCTKDPGVVMRRNDEGHSRETPIPRGFRHFA